MLTKIPSKLDANTASATACIPKKQATMVNDIKQNDFIVSIFNMRFDFPQALINVILSTCSGQKMEDSASICNSGAACIHFSPYRTDINGKAATAIQLISGVKTKKDMRKEDRIAADNFSG